MTDDTQTSEATLAPLVPPGTVVELRILGPGKNISSGYYNDLVKLDMHAARYYGKAKGVYWTLNPCKPDLLARANNRLRSVGRDDPLTKDDEITSRRYMFLDIDSERLPNIAATRDERNEATALAGHIRAALSGIGFPEPVCFDSGNGAYLLYRIDLPNDSASDVLIKRCLQALAHLYNRPGKAHVDTGVYNPARIMRLPGTMNCKGDETDDRKHRLCGLSLIPDRLDIVPVALLEQLASMGPKPPQPTRKHAPSGTGRSHGNGTDAYGKKALAGVLADLQAAPVGERNIALNKYSFRLAQFVAGDRLRETEARSDLEQVARDTGLPSDEIKRTIRSGWEAGLKEPDYGPPHSYSRNGHNPGASKAKHCTPTEAQSQPEYTGLVYLADVEPEAVQWLWPGRIPLGKLTILDGDPGLGKSVMTCDLAARVSTGRAMPDDTIGDLEGPAGVVLLSLEDGLADTIRPRLDAAVADVSRIAAREKVIEGTGETRVLRIPSIADIEEIERDIYALQAKLVIIDPIMAYLPADTKSYTDHDVRRVLTPLAELAERAGVAVVVLRHLNKAPGGNTLYRGGGSIGFIGAARSGLIVASDPDDESGQRCILAVNKANLAAPEPAMAYHIESADNGAALLVWDGITAHTAASLLAETSPEERTQLSEAIIFLEDLLQDGGVKASEVKRKAHENSISERTLNRAKSKLGVKSERRGAITDAYWEWVLPSVDL